MPLMQLIHRLRALLTNLLRRSAVDRDLDDELASYLELAEDEARAAGQTQKSARRQARLRLEGAAAVTEAVRSARAGAGLERLWQDVRYAVRGLCRAPGYATAAILTLSLGIGANAAVFSVVDAAMFKPLPYERPEELVGFLQVSGRGTAGEWRQMVMSWPELDRWRAERELFVSVEPYMGRRMTIDGLSPVTDGVVFLISPGMMSLLGVQPVIGRGFVAEDARSDAEVALLAEDFWRMAFDADPGVLGEPVTLNGQRHTIVGIAPATMRWRLGGGGNVAFIPLDERTQRQSGMQTLGAIARLRSGFTLDAARALFRSRIEALQLETAIDRRWDADLLPLDLRAGAGAPQGVALLTMLAAVGFVLLIACSNVANLMLTRTWARRHESAVRAALGATRGRLTRQFLTEGAVLAVGGGLLATGIAFWAAVLVPALIPDRLGLFEANPLVVDARTLAVCFLGVLLTCAMCALGPALQASRAGVATGLASGTRITGRSPSGQRLQLILQSGQVALTLVLLAGVGLLALSLGRMVATPAGYDVDKLVTVALRLPPERYANRPAEDVFRDEWRQRISAMPGLQTAAGQAPSLGVAGPFIAEGQESELAESRRSLSVYYYVGPDYFSVAGIPVRIGRALGDDDIAAAEPVAVIDERAAALHWPGESPLGQRFRDRPSGPWITVVGVVGSIKTRFFAWEGGTIQVYRPLSQFPRFGGPLTMLVRTEGTPESAFPVVRSVAHSIEPAVEIQSLAPVGSLFEETFTEPRFFLLLMAGFAALAVLTAAVGLCGIVNSAVGRRTNEIGVRMALGANMASVRRLVLREAMMPTALGIAGGLMAAWWLTRYLSTLLYETDPHDPAAFGFVVAFLVGVAALAAYVPARRATRINPVETLRAE
jgi:predicted permease